MIHKKLAASLFACALIFTVGGSIAVPAAAKTTKTLKTVKTTVAALPHCTIEDCNIMEDHWHDGVCYDGHFLDDGCDWHVACDVNGCHLTTEHEHDGIICMGHCATDGHSWHTTSHRSSRRGHCGSGRGKFKFLS